MMADDAVEKDILDSEWVSQYSVVSEIICDNEN